MQKGLFMLATILLMMAADAVSQPAFIKIGSHNIQLLADKFDANPHDLKKEYYHYLYLIQKNILYKKERQKLKKLPKYASLSYETGDITLLEKESYIMLFEEVEHKINVLSYDIAKSENTLKTMLDTLADMVPADDSLVRYVSFEIIEFIEKQLEKSPRGNDTLFLKMENMMLEMGKFEEELNYFNNIKLPYARKIEKYVDIKYKNEDFETSLINDQILTVFKIYEDYLNILNQYNQMAIEIEKQYDEMEN